jgi:hypothetical protein
MPPLLVKWMTPEVVGFQHCKERLQFALADAARAARLLGSSEIRYPAGTDTQ